VYLSMSDWTVINTVLIDFVQNSLHDMPLRVIYWEVLSIKIPRLKFKRTFSPSLIKTTLFIRD
jgi:hypothetical protein